MGLFGKALAQFACVLSVTCAGEADENSLLQNRELVQNLEARAKGNAQKDMEHNTMEVGALDEVMRPKGFERSVRQKRAPVHPLTDKFGLDATVSGKLGMCKVTRCYDNISAEVYFDQFINHTQYGPDGFDLYKNVEIAKKGRDCCGLGAGAVRILAKKDGSKPLTEEMLKCQPSSFFRFRVLSLDWPNHYINQNFAESIGSNGAPRVCITRETAFGPTRLPHSAVCKRITNIQKSTMNTIAAYIQKQTTPVTKTCLE